MLSNIFSAVLPLRPSRPEPTPPRDISPSSTSSDSDDASDGVPETQPEPFFPALWDVLKVRYLLQWKVPNGLPKELVDLIVDAAEYWPSWEQSMEGERHVQKDQDQVLLKTVPLCYDRQVRTVGCGYN
ncbi:hypothetical protein NUU61_007049 [Penicillium alfredii]|uniref:Uncharacterized protein n=1 Tax=Penicillium alfredii TaxID=1506179 RepID=A0A9W9F245_9EURO|nr:uncharacterized protein NUU61_007049 [Penicillium alfredii]KAJ5092179.1 hypothetical protein NUU61_007049 [Penicillium alfredii]